MAQDKNGKRISIGTRVLIHAIVQALPAFAGGPITVKIGDGEALGSNISVHGKHLLLHPDEPAVLSDDAYLKEAVKPKADKPDAKPGQSIIVEDGKFVHSGAKPNPGELEQKPGFNPTGEPSGLTEEGAVTPHTTPDNATPRKGTDFPAGGKTTL